MNIETPTKVLQKNAKEVYGFLTDLKNFEILMPGNISKFEVLNDERFLFALKGMPEIVLQKKDQIPFEKVVLGAASDKLPFTLTAKIMEIGPGESEVTLSFDGEFNAMMAMMIKSPITNFMATLSDNLSKV